MTSPRGGSPHDAALLRRAAIVVGLQTAGAVALVVALVTAAALVVDARQRSAEARRLVQVVWSRADDVDDPPPDAYVIVRSADGETVSTPGSPARVRALDPATLPDGLATLGTRWAHLLVFTGQREGGRTTAVYDVEADDPEQRRVLLSLTVAAILGVIGAGLVGAMVGRRAVRPLGEALALQRNFVADASHELRTPLSVLQLRAQLVRRQLGASADPRGVAQLERLVLDTKNLGDVVTDLLLSAQLEGGEAPGEPVDLDALARDVVEGLLPVAQERRVRLLATGPGVPVVVDGAPAALRRALLALADNALAHTSEGGEVAIETAVRGDRVRVLVRDDGEGLDPTSAHRLVRRFARETPGGDGRRFGLGLALVAEVARAHGGTLEIDGEPGIGARFTLVLPLHLPGAVRRRVPPRSRS